MGALVSLAGIRKDMMPANCDKLRVGRCSNNSVTSNGSDGSTDSGRQGRVFAQGSDYGQRRGFSRTGSLCSDSSHDQENWKQNVPQHACHMSQHFLTI